MRMCSCLCTCCCFNGPAPTEIYTYGHTLSLLALFRPRRPMRAMMLLSANTRVIAIFCACLAGDPKLFWWFEIGPLTIVAMLAILRSEEHTSELQSLMRISYAVFCLKKKIKINTAITSVLLIIIYT